MEHFLLGYRRPGELQRSGMQLPSPRSTYNRSEPTTERSGGDESKRRRRSIEQMLKRLSDENENKTFHTEFYLKLTSLNEKISLFKQVFYSKRGRFDKPTAKQL